MKPLRLRDTALAALLRCLLQLRCCTPLPLCNTLFQRLALLSDTSLVQSAFRQRLLAPFSTASRIVTIIDFFPQCGALELFAYGFYVNTLNDYSLAFSIFQNPTLDIFLFSAVFASAHVSVLSKISSSCVDFTFTKLECAVAVSRASVHSVFLLSSLRCRKAISLDYILDFCPFF